jgi:CRISPR-associated exonuclease Cas4
LILPLLVLLVLALSLCALLALGAARRARRRAALPAGKILYSDTGRESRPQKTLVSVRYGLKGRPDYLIETADGIVPVEIKSAAFPRSGRPHEAHLMQLACYCLLCEETTGLRVPYGLLRYRDREVSVEFDEELRARLLSLLEEMRAAKSLPVIHRSHSQPQRCAACGFRDVCDESLAS